MKAHRNAIERFPSVYLPITVLHKFAAIDGAVGWLEVEVIWFAELTEGIGDGGSHIEAVTNAPYEYTLTIAVVANDGAVNGLKHHSAPHSLKSVGARGYSEEYRHMIYRPPVDATGNVSNGIRDSRREEKQVSIAEFRYVAIDVLLRHKRQ